MHSKNRYKAPHNFKELSRLLPELEAYHTLTPEGNLSLDFQSPAAVRLLNKALLLRDYGLHFWDLPEGSLCPGVPGRLDYIHIISDLLSLNNRDYTGTPLGLDVGTGASLIYPILGVREYGWKFVASDIDSRSLTAARAIVKFNKVLTKRVELRLQKQTGAIFEGIVRLAENYSFSMCNPPFFESREAAQAAAKAKWSKIKGITSDQLNFGGQANELWTPGGEAAFLRKMIRESERFKTQIGWFTTLVSQKGYLKVANNEFRRVHPKRKEVIELTVGTKIRRVLAWSWT